MFKTRESITVDQNHGQSFCTFKLIQYNSCHTLTLLLLDVEKGIHDVLGFDKYKFSKPGFTKR